MISTPYGQLNQTIVMSKRSTNALREYKQTITLNPMQKEVIVGTLLGDASIPLKIGKARWKPKGGPKDLPTLCVKFVQTIAGPPEPNISGIYMTFFITRSGDFVGAPCAPNDLQVRVILVALVLPGFINLCGLKHTITQSSNFMIKSSTSTINTKVGAEKKSS